MGFTTTCEAHADFFFRSEHKLYVSARKKGSKRHYLRQKATGTNVRDFLSPRDTVHVSAYNFV